MRANLKPAAAGADNAWKSGSAAHLFPERVVPEMTARVLVVDDSAGSVALLEAYLKFEYLEVVSASNGPQALARIAEREPDLVVLDLLMEGMDGFEVCRRIKSDPGTTHVPVLIVSSLDAPTDRAKAFNVGADDYMMKPLHSPSFIARVRSLIQSKRVIDELRVAERTGREMRFQSGAGATVPEIDIAGGQLLLVADDRTTVNQIRSALVPEHQVHIDRDADDALLVTKRGEFDAILVDLSLEGADGLRLCSQLRNLEETRHTPLLAIARERDIVARVRALEMGVNGFVTLPVHIGELQAGVNSQLRRKRYADALRRNLRQSLERAVKDPLTSMHKRRFLESLLGPLVAQNVERGRPVSLLIMDVDHFKAVNDTYGHDVGDAVLREVAGRISSSLRGIDLSCRFGGEEFVVAFSGIDGATVVQIAERIRCKVADRPVPIVSDKGPLQVTISIGAATTFGSDDTAAALLKRADQALYRAKKDGRNRVAHHEKWEEVAGFS